MSIKKRIQQTVDEYYDRPMNVVQTYKDPNVNNCYVVRFEDDDGNWCCVLNFDYVEESSEEAMMEDCIELQPGQKISKKMFGPLRFV